MLFLKKKKPTIKTVNVDGRLVRFDDDFLIEEVVLILNTDKNLATDIVARFTEEDKDILHSLWTAAYGIANSKVAKEKLNDKYWSLIKPIIQ